MILKKFRNFRLWYNIKWRWSFLSVPFPLPSLNHVWASMLSAFCVQRANFKRTTDLFLGEKGSYVHIKCTIKKKCFYVPLLLLYSPSSTIIIFRLLVFFLECVSAYVWLWAHFRTPFVGACAWECKHYNIYNVWYNIPFQYK